MWESAVNAGTVWVLGELLQMEASYRCYLLKSGQIDAPVLREYWWYRCYVCLTRRERLPGLAAA
jgi:hypothetical protein